MPEEACVIDCVNFKMTRRSPQGGGCTSGFRMNKRVRNVVFDKGQSALDPMSRYIMSIPYRAPTNQAINLQDNATSRQSFIVHFCGVNKRPISAAVFPEMKHTIKQLTTGSANRCPAGIWQPGMKYCLVEIVAV